jgi:hypothetical protein
MDRTLQSLEFDLPSVRVEGDEIAAPALKRRESGSPGLGNSLAYGLPIKA